MKALWKPVKHFRDNSTCFSNVSWRINFSFHKGHKLIITITYSLTCIRNVIVYVYFCQLTWAGKMIKCLPLRTVAGNDEIFVEIDTRTIALTIRFKYRLWGIPISVMVDEARKWQLNPKCRYLKEREAHVEDCIWLPQRFL